MDSSKTYSAVLCLYVRIAVVLVHRRATWILCYLSVTKHDATGEGEICCYVSSLTTPSESH